MCDDGKTLQGTMILWLPRRLVLNHLPNPWARTYKKEKFSLLVIVLFFKIFYLGIKNTNHLTVHYLKPSLAV